MIRTVTTKEELYVRIYSPSEWGMDQMGGYRIPEKVFYDEPYTFEETAEMYLTLAKKEHAQNPHHAWAKTPIREDYWKVIEVQEEYD